MGGFESSTHQRRDRQRIDAAHESQHDLQCEHDYALLRACGIRTVRDGLRWHHIEHDPGVFDWSSFVPMLQASHRAGMQVVWDLCHWGVPPGLDPFSEEFPSRFARFAKAAAEIVRAESERAGNSFPRVFCPMNEISFWSWVGGDTSHFFPYGAARGREFKEQLVRASLAATRAIREVDPEARFMHAEPIIHISGEAKVPGSVLAAANHTASQFEALDMLAGLQSPELGGGADGLDLIGVNFYWNNQWVHEGERTPLGHHAHRPLHVMLQEMWERFQRPLLISETGAEAAADVGWLGYVSSEVRQALRIGVPMLGLCLYPVMDYAGWDDARHCSCGLIEVSADWTRRTLRPGLRAELALQQSLLGQAQAAQAHVGS